MPRLGLPEDGTIPVFVFPVSLAHSHTRSPSPLSRAPSPILCPAQGDSKVETGN